MEGNSGNPFSKIINKFTGRNRGPEARQLTPREIARNSVHQKILGKEGSRKFQLVPTHKDVTWEGLDALLNQRPTKIADLHYEDQAERERKVAQIRIREYIKLEESVDPYDPQDAEMLDKAGLSFVERPKPPSK